MRVFALSDIHIDYDANAKWVAGLSLADYQGDLLILAGDVTDRRRLLEWGLGTLARRFRQVLFVPGNHELWVVREDRARHSLQKFDDVCGIVEASGASMRAFRQGRLSIVPLLGWYDYSLGEPSDQLKSIWMDYRACRWPAGLTERDIAAHFAALNCTGPAPAGDLVITYSHFVPRIDVMAGCLAGAYTLLSPILGSARLERQLRTLRPSMHVYGHSHVNRRVTIDGVAYINNAFGYPSETWITSRRLLCIHEC